VCPKAKRKKRGGGFPDRDDLGRKGAAEGEKSRKGVGGGSGCWGGKVVWGVGGGGSGGGGGSFAR